MIKNNCHRANIINWNFITKERKPIDFFGSWLFFWVWNMMVCIFSKMSKTPGDSLENNSVLEGPFCFATTVTPNDPIISSIAFTFHAFQILQGHSLSPVKPRSHQQHLLTIYNTCPSFVYHYVVRDLASLGSRRLCTRWPNNDVVV